MIKKIIPLTEKQWRILISAFILWNAVAIVFSSTKPTSQQSTIERFFYPYLLWTRLNQRWRLFTPTPRHEAFKFRTDVELKNGTLVQWRRPYPPKWDFFERHLSYNFQKWDLATVN